MDIRPRFFIKTKDNLFFAVTHYHHPDTHYLAFLRYVPCVDGPRQANGIRYKKLDSYEAYRYVEKHHPDYLFDWNVENKKMMGVLKEDVDEILSPIDKLDEIRNNGEDSRLYTKIRLLSDIFHREAGIAYENMGVSGSTLLNLQDDSTSDIDFIVFGRENHRRAIDLYSRLKNDPDSPLEKISGDYWRQVYEKRIKDDSMTIDEFVWYESRKNNRGIICGTLFDILFTKNPDEIGDEDEIYFKPLGKIIIRCKIVDDENSYGTPAIYKVSDVEFLEGDVVNIEKIVSFTHTYTGIVKNNEEVIASGVCEEATRKDSSKVYNLLIGSTRESLNEYVKLAESPLKR